VCYCCRVCCALLIPHLKAHVGSLEVRRCARTRLRFEAAAILAAPDKSDSEVAADIAKAVATLRSTILVPFYGQPPSVLKHGDKTVTPLEFYNSQPSTFRPLDYCCLVNAPDSAHPMMKKMTIESLGDSIA
jgi:aminopeptidase C